MLAAYRPLFAAPGARSLVAASLLGRLPVAIESLPVLLIARKAGGGFAQGGAALAAGGIAIAISSPLRGRLIDRVGVRRGIAPLVVVFAPALALIPAAAHLGAWAVVALTTLAGLSAPTIVAGMRLQWQRLLGRGDPRLDQAYAFEATAQVALFVVGPLIAGAGIAVVGPEATLVATAALALTGGLSFCALAVDVPHAQRQAAAGARRPPIRVPALRVLLLAVVVADAALGILDVAVAAFAVRHGQPGAAGVLLAVVAGSSVAGGALYGARRWSAPPERRIMALMLAGALLAVPLTLAGSVPVLALLLIAGGATYAAQWATLSVIVDKVAPAGADAETYAWLSSANAAGVAAGSALAGALVDAHGPAAAFLSVTAVLLAAGGIMAAGRRRFTPEAAARG